jgi:hypothetical protein
MAISLSWHRRHQVFLQRVDNETVSCCILKVLVTGMIFSELFCSGR